jgi:hypothetical protein
MRLLLADEFLSPLAFTGFRKTSAATPFISDKEIAIGIEG